MNLWGDHEIPMLGVTGEVGTGKTKFLLSIAPPDRTIIFDTEMSSKDTKAYVDRGLTRIDVANAMFELHPNGYTEEQLFVWFLTQVRQIPAGKYDAILVDVANDLESGLTDWVANRHEEFRFGSAALFRSMKGVFYNFVKSEWSKIKLDICQRCQTFGFANHMRDRYEGNKPTGEREARGKDTFFKLSALYLEMDFQPEDPAPSAKVLKGRLDGTEWDEHGIAIPIPIIRKGMRIPNASPNTIRQYIAHPIGSRQLTEEEQPRVLTLTEDQRLQMQLDKARFEAMAAEAQTTVVKEAQELERQKSVARERALALMQGDDDPAPTITTKTANNPIVVAPPQSLRATAEPTFAVSPQFIRGMLEEAERKNAKNSTVFFIQEKLGETQTGTLTKAQAARITPELLQTCMDSILKVAEPATQKEVANASN